DHEVKDLRTLQTRLPELHGLLVAMETARTENGWAYAGDRTAAPGRAGTRTSDGFGSGSGRGRGGGDPYTLTNYAAGATDVAQYVKILQTERWATNEVKDIEAYLNDVLADGTWQTRSLMNLSADTR